MQQSAFSYFNNFTWVQLLDITLLLLLILQLFRALKGSIAFNIFLGALVIYVLWLIVTRLHMPLMSEVLDRLVSIGLIGLIVVFQPEIRKFLIVLGRRSALGRNGFISRFFQSNSLNKYIIEEEVIEELVSAIRFFQEKNWGATLILVRNERFDFDAQTGNYINGIVSAALLQSIFSKQSPLHDGAVVIDKNILIAAGVVLPLSHSNTLPVSVGMRHRSAVGATEHNNVLAIIVSEENAKVSVASNGKLYIDVALEEVKKYMYDAMTG